MTPIGRAVGVVAALVAPIGIGWASTLRTTPNDSASAVLRLAWTARPERIENCRAQSDDELAKIPAHMRQAVVCEGTTAAYRLEVRRDSLLLVDQIVRGGGVRHDRPLYVSRDIALPSGEAMVSVRFTRIDSVEPPATASAKIAHREQDEKDGERHPAVMDPDRRRHEDEERVRLRGEIAPAILSLEQRFRFVPRQVILVTYDSDRRELVARAGAAR
jgi:hypothetical protein